jgi:hypothetical protein
MKIYYSASAFLTSLHIYHVITNCRKLKKHGVRVASNYVTFVPISVKTGQNGSNVERSDTACRSQFYFLKKGKQAEYQSGYSTRHSL